MLAKLEPGDVLLVTRLDRLARSTRDLLNVLDSVSKAGARGFLPRARLAPRRCLLPTRPAGEDAPP